MADFDTSGTLYQVTASGNAWTIFFPLTTKKINDTLVEEQREGLNRLIAQKLLVELKQGEVSQITYFDQPDGIFYPMQEIDPKDRWIKGFKWNPSLRPRSAITLRQD